MVSVGLSAAELQARLRQKIEQLRNGRVVKSKQDIIEKRKNQKPSKKRVNDTIGMKIEKPIAAPRPVESNLLFGKIDFGAQEKKKSSDLVGLLKKVKYS